MHRTAVLASQTAVPAMSTGIALDQPGCARVCVVEARDLLAGPDGHLSALDQPKRIALTRMRSADEARILVSWTTVPLLAE